MRFNLMFMTGYWFLMEMKLSNYQITKLVASDVEVDVMHKSGATYWKLEVASTKRQNLLYKE